MGYRPKYLQHANLFVRNAELSMHWYADILGLHSYDFVPDRAAFMSADIEQSHEIALLQVGDDAPGPEKGRVGLNHLGWQMESLDDLKELYLRLKEKNVNVYQVSDHGISIGIYFNDPDGNGIEISYELPRDRWPSQKKIFSGSDVVRGLFPGPWDELLTEVKSGVTANAPVLRS